MSVIKCSYCGKELPGESNFCPYCMEQINKPVEVSIPKEKKKFRKDLFGMVLITVFLSALTAGLLISHYYETSASKDDIKINGTTDDTNKTQGLQIFEDIDETEGESRPEEGNITEGASKLDEKAVTTDRNANTGEDMSAGADIPVNGYTAGGTTPHKTPNTTLATTQKNNNGSSLGNTSQGNLTENKEEKTTRGNYNGNVVVTQTNECRHNWVAQTKIVHHEEVGHYEDVTMSRPVKIYRCGVCAKKFDSINKYYNHFDNTHKPMYDGDPITIFRDEYTTGTEYEDYTETQWVLDEDAYDETVITGYKCSQCGKYKDE